MDRCRLSLVVSGAFLHPLEQTPIDLRCSEEIATDQTAVRQLIRVTRSEPLTFPPLVDPRCVIVTNLAGVGLTAYPTAEAADAIARQVLLVGLLPAAAGASQEPAWLRLLPARPGRDAEGQSQVLWLSAGVRILLAPEMPCGPVPARILAFPRGEVSRET